MHTTWAEQAPLLATIFFANGEMLVWSLMLAVMALPYLAEWRLKKA